MILLFIKKGEDTAATLLSSNGALGEELVNKGSISRAEAFQAHMTSNGRVLYKGITVRGNGLKAEDTITINLKLKGGSRRMAEKTDRQDVREENETRTYGSQAEAFEEEKLELFHVVRTQERKE